nr:hypothetical protein GCM10020185_53890 [Pseudomonas brassicacearum subsp. brassicacearum]
MAHRWGVWLVNALGLWSMGVSIILLGLLGLALAWRKTAAPIVTGERLPFMHVLGRVLPHGCGLALGSIGFGTIATFITLYYATQHWDNAVLCLSLFGASFIGARLLFGNLINRLGGFRVAIACLSVETLGLLLLWLAPDAHWALAGAALSGFGFSLVFPALGVEAVNLVPASSRGAAVGAYSLFIDLSLGITGPLAGAIAAGFGFASIFLFAALAALGGLALSVYLYRQAPRHRQEREKKLEVHLAAPGLDRAALGLGFQATLFFRTQGRFCRTALLFDLGGAEDQFGQALQGIGPVLFLRTVLLGLDDQYTIAGNATVAQGQQPLLVELGQRRGRNVEAQMHSAGDLVDVLPPCPLGADGRQLDLGVRDVHGVGNRQHGKYPVSGPTGYSKPLE